jgi:hypothetical protein
MQNKGGHIMIGISSAINTILKIIAVFGLQ